MGTRGAVGFISNGIEKITYNYFDSYPEGLGNNVLNFLHTIINFEELKIKVNNIILVDGKGEPTIKQIKHCIAAKTADMEVREQSYKDWYCLLRHTQGNLEKYFEVGIMLDSKDFLFDSLFCEWAYIINLDTYKLEIYKGFNEDQNGKGRYASQHRERDGNQYYGVKLIYEVDLFNLPKEFEVHCNDEVDKSYLELIYGYDEGWKNIKLQLDE
jgi:hypothetical protein